MKINYYVKQMGVLTFLLGSLVACSNMEYNEQHDPIAKSMANPKESVVEQRMELTSSLDAVYCAQTGFSKFHESKHYYTFTCKDFGVFRIPK